MTSPTQLRHQIGRRYAHETAERRHSATKSTTSGPAGPAGPGPKHAVQDQHFAVGDRLKVLAKKIEKTSTEEYSVLDAIREGDAERTEHNYLGSQPGRARGSGATMRSLLTIRHPHWHWHSRAIRSLGDGFLGGVGVALALEGWVKNMTAKLRAWPAPGIDRDSCHASVTHEGS